SRLSVSPQGKQKVLEILDQGQRLEEVYGHLVSASTTQTLEKRIRARVREQMDKSQREYYLTEQIKAINKELGRDFDPQEELNTLEKRLKEKELPDAARERGLAEVKKLRGMTTMAPEYTILHTYVDWILDLPWTKMADADIDIDRARSILDNNHYGIEKPKERILEYLAVQKLSKGLRGPILCLVGPPGVGKTSLAKSVAEATGREYVRLSLGGVRDEAEIRGHRRTYIGALPGKIIQSLKRVKTSNPLFCLDEIDKMTCSERGDPAAALLEVLDPEQNATYMDHYLDLDYDLSKVFFITTANSLDGIPGPLLDRMEVIELHSYLETEKFHIARSFLIPRQVAENSVKPENLGLPDETLRAIIREYTAEAGVRALERRIAKLCRRAAIEMLGHKDLNFRLDVAPGDLAGIFGAATSRHDRKEEAPGVGVCTGLAWTRMGGEILFVETGIMAGTGVVSTTGKLGEVMQESARAALSYVRSHASELGLAPDFHKKVDIHVHVPDGATPKDGPSAGITIATALVSALLNIPVRDDVAMTGEITLRGRVLPIGGLREKLLAAKRAGI
ncbi:MAG: endopeptidase La, partial [Desulfovibrionaceae bacterium]|nr:endopeptidase La [Desulfovibrionaceae bacterium]